MAAAILCSIWDPPDEMQKHDIVFLKLDDSHSLAIAAAAAYESCEEREPMQSEH